VLNLKISDYAKGQIKGIADYGRKHWGQLQSDEYTNDLFGVLEMLQQYPNAGRLFEYDWAHFVNEKIYLFPNKSHQIFYLVAENAVEIIAIGGSWQLPENVLP